MSPLRKFRFSMSITLIISVQAPVGDEKMTIYSTGSVSCYGHFPHVILDGEQLF